MVINPCKLSNTSLSYNSSHYIHRSYLCLSRTANFAGSSVFCDLLLEGLGVFFCAFNLHFHRKLSEINCKCTYSTAFIIHIIIHNCIWYFLDCYMVWYEYTIKEYVSNYPKKNLWKRSRCLCTNMAVYRSSCFMQWRFIKPYENCKEFNNVSKLMWMLSCSKYHTFFKQSIFFLSLRKGKIRGSPLQCFARRFI